LNGARGLRKEQSRSIGRKERPIALRQQIGYIYRGIKARGKQISQPQSLPQIATEISLIPKRSIWINRCH
jgi:hypothetical protein